MTTVTVEPQIRVKVICRICKNRRGSRLSLLTPHIVSRTGVVHAEGPYGTTLCGRDATGDSWRWRS